MSERWLVAMSGGVDSSVAAALLARAGHEVVGVTMDLGEGLPGAREPSSRAARKKCCGLPDAEDARDVAEALGIRHYTANYRDEFRRAVIEPFAAEYAAGRTPIPCIACNRVLKFDLLLRRADALGARGVATGHYARIAPAPDGGLGLFRPRDRDKDQTYFLFDLPRPTLARVAFPLGELAKPEVRAARARARPGHRREAREPGNLLRPGRGRALGARAASPRRAPVSGRDRHAPTAPTSAGTTAPSVSRRGSAAASGCRAAPGTCARSIRRRTASWSRAPRRCRRAACACATRAGWTARGPRGRCASPCAHRHKSVSAEVVAAVDGATEIHFDEAGLGTRARTGGRRLRRSRRSRSRRRVDHWRGRVSNVWTRSVSVSGTASRGRSSCVRRSRTARSANEAGDLLLGNERLEFLGDAVLGLCVAELLMAAHPAESEGALSRARAAGGEPGGARLARARPRPRRPRPARQERARQRGSREAVDPRGRLRGRARRALSRRRLRSRARVRLARVRGRAREGERPRCGTRRPACRKGCTPPAVQPPSYVTIGGIGSRRTRANSASRRAAVTRCWARARAARSRPPSRPPRRTRCARSRATRRERAPLRLRRAAGSPERRASRSS